MLAIPRLEVRSGLAVQSAGPGDADNVSALGDPIAVARSLGNLGFHRIHVVDGDAIAGSGSNADRIEDVIRDGSVEVEVSDGTDSADGIERMLSAGAVRVVVGSRGLEERDWLTGVAELYPGLLIVSTDVRERRVVTRGWVRTLPLDILDLASELTDLPLGGLLICRGVTEGNRGLDLSLLEDIAEASDAAVYAELTQTTPNDLRALENRGIAGVLLGTSLFNGDLDARHIALEFSE
jgi:phosphoribosylformimino-5-aminoimidazole carboxamide ribotide isomerase